MSTQGRPPDDRMPPSRYPPGSPQHGLEERLSEEERRIGANRQVAVAALALAVLLVVAVAALAVALVALNRDVEAASTAEPAGDSVGTDALQDGAVTAEKIAANAVGTDALADAAVTGAKVAPDSLTGANIDESTLERVPSAENARNAANLGQKPAAAYLSGVTLVQAESDSNADEAKGPITASCPADTIAIGGGASLEVTTSGIAIVESAPADGQTGWTARAQAFVPTTTDWRLVVSVICATGGS